MKKLISYAGMASICLVALVSVAHADIDQSSTASTSQPAVERAQVTRVVSHKTEIIPGINIRSEDESLDAEIVAGSEQGKDIFIQDEQIPLAVGDVFYVQHTVDSTQAVDTYAVLDSYRLPAIYFFIGLFVLCVLIFGGIQGARGLVALALSFVAILYLLLPGILHGYSPVLVSIGVASLMIILGSYVTHGFNKVTSSAVVGMIVTILFTGVLAYAAIHFGKLSGFNTEETTYLNMDTGGTIDFAGLLLGGILIGLLGVLYDAAISQAVAVDELHHVAPHLSRRVIWQRAMRIGREHVGALVNILAIAYVGASLPLLLLFYESGADVAYTVNQELFATEIIRAMIGSIGLILAVPITTLIAVFLLMNKESDNVPLEKLEQEREVVERFEHRH